MPENHKSLVEILKNYDAYAKTFDDLQVKTVSGAVVTIVAVFLMAMLFLSEVHDYVTPKLTEDLFVDTTRGSKLKINLDVVFPSIPCDMLSLDAMDLSGEQHINIQHNLYKRRLDLNGKPLQDPERQTEIGHGFKALADIGNTSVVETTVKPECESCYGAEYGEVKCCNSCEEVKEAYRRKGWAIPVLSTIEQCRREGKLTESRDLPKEGCQIYGYLEVNRVGGNFHIAPGKSYQHSHIHVHDVQQYRTSDFDLSHQVRHLSFGTNIPGKTNPVDGLEHKTEKGTHTVNYYIKIVPTTFQRIDGSTLSTNQFSVTQHEKLLYLIAGKPDFDCLKSPKRRETTNQKLNFLLGDSGLPGVFFTYELSPMMVKYTEERKSLSHFLTGLCAIMGGIYTVAGLIDALIYHSVRAVQKKMELGKTS